MTSPTKGWFSVSLCMASACLRVLSPFAFGPAAPPSALAGRLEAAASVLDDRLPLKLVEGCGHVEEQPSLGRACIDVLGEHLESDAAPVDVSGCPDDLGEGPRQPGEYPNHERVAFAQEVERGFKLGPVTVRAGGPFSEDPLAARRLQYILWSAGFWSVVETREYPPCMAACS